MSDTEPEGLIRAFLVGGIETAASEPVPDISKRTVLMIPAGTNASFALPDAVIVSPTPNIVLCGA